MTSKSTTILQSKKYKPINPSSVTVGLLSLFSLLLLLKNTDMATEYMRSALYLCGHTLIPSLFPFMIISELIVSGSAVGYIGRLFARPFRRLFGIAPEGAVSVILGMLCGFPIGAKSAAALYRQGRLSTTELSRLLTFCNIPSIGFLVSAVGSSMFANKHFGILLYTLSVLSALLTGFIVNLLANRQKHGQKKEKNARNSVRLNYTCEPREKRGFIGILSDAVSSSVLSMLNVCALVLLFTTLVGTLECILTPLGLPSGLFAIFLGFFELTGGMKRAAELSELGAYVASFLSGWSGLSVHFQIMSLCSYEEVSFKPYLASKLFQGALNLGLFALIQAVTPLRL